MARIALHALLVMISGLACSARVEVDGARAHARVVHQVRAGPRIPGMPGHAAIGTWIENELRRLGARVETQGGVDTTLGRPIEVRNIVGAFGPAGGRPLALCAHWDSRPWSDQDPDSALRDSPVPGANDGASGVAVLLEVAELMARRKPAVPVVLVFFDAEDQGRDGAETYCLGSRLFASRYAGHAFDSRPRAALVFDMVGGRDMLLHPEITSRERASNLVDIVLEAARATGAHHFDDLAGHLVYDDHVPLLEAGIPAVDIIDFDYPAWHTHRDLPDQVSPQSLEEVARVAAWIVYQSPLSRPLTP